MENFMKEYEKVYNIKIHFSIESEPLGTGTENHNIVLIVSWAACARKGRSWERQLSFLCLEFRCHLRLSFCRHGIILLNSISLYRQSSTLNMDVREQSSSHVLMNPPVILIPFYSYFKRIRSRCEQGRILTHRQIRRETSCIRIKQDQCCTHPQPLPINIKGALHV